MNFICSGRRPAKSSRSRPLPRSRISEAASRGRTITGLAAGDAFSCGGRRPGSVSFIAPLCFRPGSVNTRGDKRMAKPRPEDGTLLYLSRGDVEAAGIGPAELIAAVEQAFAALAAGTARVGSKG